MGPDRTGRGPGCHALLSYPRANQLVREATFPGPWEMFSLDGFWFVKRLFFSWTNQIPSSSFSALSVQLWLTGPGWVATQGAGIVSANSLPSVAEFRGQTGEGAW